jgi:hypothetical protein
MTSYKFKLQRITPAVAKELILTYIDSGVPISRSDIVSKISEVHIRLGGIESSTNLNHTVKKALNDLSKSDIAHNAGYGYWKISGFSENKFLPEESQEEIPSETAGPSETADESTAVSFEDDDDVSVDGSPTFGEGRESVYAYYYPTYRKFAEVTGEDSWPIKIGRTLSKAEWRVKNQVGTALPEYPEMCLVFKTDSSSLVETLLHATLEFRGKRIMNSPGKEWFLTNQEEILSVLGYQSEPEPAG